jgi:hypothetical protein
MKVRVALLAVVAAGVIGASALGATGTRTVIYRAFTSSGQPTITVTKTVRGSCFAASIAADRNDAWRCMSGNLIHDPCFSSTRAKGIVLCPAAAWKRSGIKIKLTAALPRPGNKPKPSTSGRPWAIKTTSGLRCAVLTGMAPVSGKHFGSYLCSDGEFLWDAPNRKTSPWTIGIGKTKPTGKAQVRVAWF